MAVNQESEDDKKYRVLLLLFCVLILNACGQGTENQEVSAWYGEDGTVSDYLIHSNTADVKNFPASAYMLPCQSLTKIYGWNG